MPPGWHPTQHGGRDQVAPLKATADKHNNRFSPIYILIPATFYITGSSQ